MKLGDLGYNLEVIYFYEHSQVFRALCYNDLQTGRKAFFTYWTKHMWERYL